MDGLKAINVYVIQSDDGLTLIDGGWAIPQARELLDRCLRDIGSGFGDIRRFLVTHIHRDHFTMATVLGHEFGADVVARDRREARGSSCSTTSRRSRAIPFAQILVSAGRDRRRRGVDRRHRAHGATRARAVGLPRHLARRRPRDRGRPAHRRRGAHAGPHARPLRVRREGRRPAVRRRPRAADDHPVDRVHRPGGRAAAGRLPGVAGQGAIAARPADPARARAGGAVVPRPGRRAARHHEYAWTCA